MALTTSKRSVAAIAGILSTLTISAGCASSRGTAKPRLVREPEMVLIRGGEFAMGKDGDADHSPAHTVHVDSFHLDKFEVTNAHYLKFVEETKGRLPEFWGMKCYGSGTEFPNRPVIGVSWQEASKYAQWAGKRLPTEAEWEYASRGALVGKEYPHGDQLDPSLANYWRWDLLKPSGGGIQPVGSYAPNGYGLHDMAGNVAEWVADAYDPNAYKTNPDPDSTESTVTKFRVFRGGGWHSGPTCIRVYYRNALPGNWRDFNVGFRCAKDAP